LGRFRVFFILIMAVYSLPTYAATSQEELNADKTISLLQLKLNQRNLLIYQRLFEVGSAFVGRPYLLSALGEGAEGRYDQYPLYRTDAFDCQTFVETVLAIALTNNTKSFKQCIKKIRYQDGVVSFVTRNHFTDLDWNVNNQRAGILKDITLTFHDEQNQRVALQATAKIDKPLWYQHFSLERIRLLQASLEEQRKRLIDLKKLGNQLQPENVIIPYIPLTALFDSKGTPNHYLFKQIPDGAILEIIRPNWDLTDSIGTHLNVSHLGFVFWKNGVPIFRNATTIRREVVDQPLIDYLHEARKSPTIKGINIQLVSMK
jgi:hypothetical protein